VDQKAVQQTIDLYNQLLDAKGNHMYVGQHQHENQTTVDAYRMDNFEAIAGVDHYIFSTDYEWMTTTKRQHLIDHDAKGGMIMLSWHMGNVVTSGDEKDLTGDPVVNVLAGGTHRTEFLAEIDAFCTWAKALKDADGNLIPILFRPYHENDGGWFWWGIDTCTEAQFIQLYRDTVDRILVNEVHNVLFIYNPQVINSYEYLGTLYPGDRYVDIFGVDRYSNESTITSILSSYEAACDAANLKKKPWGITEGVRHLVDYPLVDYWDDWLMTPITTNAKAKQASFISFWTSPNWGPYPDRLSTPSFVDLLDNPYLRFLDIEE
jgi:mannan endo-1,4-beta-mannosidase